eukprot:TRINITY_DN1514_c0_g1_i8.p1 TRINITY_DN1514_c0_g1~~TRINITY_DN1514_c0_g1_i8.p1  ORF type:complete len:296 (-),score=48.87 TRINITY_DN1514_c0_g1_i8:98-919(-)
MAVQTFVAKTCRADSITPLMQGKAAVLSVALHLAFAPLPASARQNIGALVRSKIALSNGIPVTKAYPDDFSRTAFIGGGNPEASWFVFFCDTNSRSIAVDCQAVRQNFHDLGKSWLDVRFDAADRAHFAEVDCSMHQNLCMKLTGIVNAGSHQPSVIHYRHGAPLEVWTPIEDSRSVEQQLEAWHKTEFRTRFRGEASVRGIMARIRKGALDALPPAFSEPSMTAFGFAVVSFQVAVVIRLLITGLSLWPKRAPKSTMESKSDKTGVLKAAHQ